MEFGGRRICGQVDILAAGKNRTGRSNFGDNVPDIVPMSDIQECLMS